MRWRSMSKIAGSTTRSRRPDSSSASRKRDAREIHIAVGMTAELQPRVQLAMVRQQHAFAVAR